MSSKTDNKCFFGVLLNEICDTLESDEFNESEIEILSRFCMREEEDSEYKNKKYKTFSQLRNFDFWVDVNAVINQIAKSRKLTLSKSKRRQSFDLSDIIGKLLTLLQFFKASKISWEYEKLQPCEFYTLRLKYSKDILNSKFDENLSK